MRSLATIFQYIKRYPALVSLYFFFNILSAVFALFSLVMLAPFLQVIFKTGESSIITSRFNFWPISELYEWLNQQVATEQGSIRALVTIVVIVIISVVLKNVFAYLALYVLNPIRNSIINDMRKDMFNKIFRLPIGYFNEQRKGDLMSRLTNDLSVIEYSTISFLEVLFREPITIIILIGSMVKLSPELSLFLLVFLPIMGFIIGRVGRSLKKMSSRVQEKLGYILSIIDETISGIRVLKAFNAENLQSKKFADENKKLLHIKNRANRRRDLGSPVSETLGVMAVCCVLWYGGRLVLGPQNNYGLKPGDFLTFIAIFSQIITPLKMISQAAYNIRNGAASIDRIQHLLQEQETIQDIPKPKVLSSFNSCIEFKDVRFAYGDAMILDNINLKIEKGKTIALVGSSGAGKSTLADLVPRFHDVSCGELLIDGVNIKEYSLESLRSQMSIVTQEPILFNDSIADNIKLGKHNATDEEVIQAAKVANAHNFIMQKENGYETNIGDRGNKLSGGERQRLTIARAVLKNPPILILDEATSSLDTESERLVQDAINNMMQNRTSIVIAHRLSTIRHANEIIVLQKGKIVERGTHDFLMHQNGFYKRLVEMQEVK
ncbi:MAG TPA: ABC transporter ATP-binding protein [Chitinophagaceae bacterium]|jgi:subfamily B ATP-binding cassette protein MsbA|nr:ABC transporter ATP-binding protein [Chitinophagaceae bacterium]